MQGTGYPRQAVAMILLWAASVPAQPPHKVCINEFMASNGTSIADEGGQYDDWIELHNPGPSSVDIGGMFLTDDLNEPAKWRLPNDRPDRTTLPAGGYVLVWADNDVGGAGLHASFKLDGDGEEIALVDRDGATLVDHVVFGKQSSDISFGRYPDAGPEWAFMTTATPGAGNAGAFAGCVADVTFSVEHGFYDEPFAVTLATEPADAQILYTLDGASPRQIKAATYDQPLLINGTTCIRAVAVKPGWKDSPSTSCTYIFVDDIAGQMAPQEPAPPPPARGRFPTPPPPSPAPSAPLDPGVRAALQALPSVCIVMEPNDFFDPVTGINANPARRGIEWERPASIEWIDPADPLSFQVNAGLRIQGGASRNSRSPKHSLRILFKSEYGPSTLTAPLLKDTDVTEFDSLVLRNTFHDSWTGGPGTAQYMRDQFSRDTMRDMGRLTPYGRPVHVYINGRYWGLFILVERPDDGFAAAHLGGSKGRYDALKARSVSDPDPSPIEVVAGDLQAWNTLFALADASLEDQAGYDLVRQYLDMPAFIDYMLMIFYIGSTDGPAGFGGPPRNFWAVRPREPGGGFVFLPWDLEFSLNNINENLMSVAGTDNPHYLFQRLVVNPEFRMLLADQAHRQLCHGALTSQSSLERYLVRSADVERALMAEAYRWGTSQTPAAVTGLCAGWRSERDRIIGAYFPLRSEIVVSQLRQAGFYPAVEPPVLEVDGAEQEGGPARTGASLALINPNEDGTVFYTTDGSDPRTPQRPIDANEWVLIVPAEAAKRVFVPQEDIGADWTGGNEPYDDAHWTAGTPVLPATGGAVGYVGGRLRDQRISYSVGGPMAGRTSCYIRIPFHLSDADLRRTVRVALRVLCDDGFVAYINGVEAASLNQPAQLAWNSPCVDRPVSADALWAVVPAAAGLLHPGENILAVHALDNSADAFFLLSVELFGSERSLFGGDPSLSAREYAGPIELPQSTQIKARVWCRGTWSALTDAVFAVGPVQESLRITEIMYHPPEPNEEFVELANVGTEAINLNRVRFVGGIDFAFPSLALAPGAVVLIVQDVESFANRYGPDLRVAGRYEGALSNAGERLRLEDAGGETIQDFRYEDTWYDQTDGDGYSLECRDPFRQDPNASSRPDYWQPSPHPGGSPGTLARPIR